MTANRQTNVQARTCSYFPRPPSAPPHGEVYRLRGPRNIHSEALDCFLDLVPRISGTAGASHGIWEEEEKQNIPKETGHEQDEGRGLKARLLSIGKELNYHEQNLVNLHDLVSPLPHPCKTKQQLKSPTSVVVQHSKHNHKPKHRSDNLPSLLSRAP